MTYQKFNEKRESVKVPFSLISGERGSLTCCILEYYLTSNHLHTNHLQKYIKNENIIEFLSLSPFLGVKLGVDFEITPKHKTDLLPNF